MGGVLLIVCAVVTAFGAAFSLAVTSAYAAESPHSSYGTDSTKCASCHSTHLGDAVLPTEDQTQALCLSCHNGQAASDIASGVGAADPRTSHDLTRERLAEGTGMACLTCHEPHRSTSDVRYVSAEDRTFQASAVSTLRGDAGELYVLFGAAHDGIAPVISGITVNDADGTAPVVSWSTDETSTTWIDWGLTDAYELGNATSGGSVGSGDFTRVHSATLAGLEPGITYHYRVRSADALGNESVSADRTFTAFVTVPEESLEALPGEEEALSNETSATVTDEPTGSGETSAGDVVWAQTHEPTSAQITYSIDTDRVVVELELRDGTRHTVEASAGWESAGPGGSAPTPATPGTAVPNNVLGNVRSDDGVYWRTDLTSVDGEWNWQLARFDLTGIETSRIARVILDWNGHGEPTPGYPTSLMMWDTAAGWIPVTSSAAGADRDVSAMRSAVSQQTCLICHDGGAPDGVVTTGLTDIGATWAIDAHGGGVTSGVPAGALVGPYARESGAIDCTVCHDEHGTTNLYHVPESVNGTDSVSVSTGSELRSLCRSCHEGRLENWHSQCVDCHANGHWAGWVDPPVTSYLPTESSDCTQCHGHGKSWTHPATCVRCHGVTELKNLHASPDAPWTYERTF